METAKRIALTEIVRQMLEDDDFAKMFAESLTLKPIVCPYCETVSPTWEEAKQHDGECALHPGNVKAAALQQRITRLEAENAVLRGGK